MVYKAGFTSIYFFIMKKFTYCLIFAAFLCTAISAKAQKSDTLKMHSWFHHDIAGAAQIQLTYRKGNIDQLNNALASNGFAPINPNNLWINASMSHINKNWIMEDGLGFTPISSSEENGVKMKYNQYQAFFRLGYNLSTSSDVRFYPFAGLNFSAAVLDIQDKNKVQSVNTLSNELLNQSATKILYQPNFGVELGLGLDYVIKMTPKQIDCVTIKRNIPVGIRAGYYINTYASDWKIDNYGLTNGPGQKQSAVFVSFNIGLGYEVKRN
jgi:hypothetical protein